MMLISLVQSRKSPKENGSMQVEVLELDWGDVAAGRCAFETGEFDVIICSDVVFWPGQAWVIGVPMHHSKLGTVS